jgi:hypothetical protein
LIDFDRGDKARRELDNVSCGDDVQLKAMKDWERARAYIRIESFPLAARWLKSAAQGESRSKPLLISHLQKGFAETRRSTLDFEELHDFVQLEKVLSQLSVVYNASYDTEARDSVVRRWKELTVHKRELGMRRLQELDEWQTWVVDICVAASE